MLRVEILFLSRLPITESAKNAQDKPVEPVIRTRSQSICKASHPLKKQQFAPLANRHRYDSICWQARVIQYRSPDYSRSVRTLRAAQREKDGKTT